ncbi:MAG: hypothetical protein Q9179_000564 [Wetmoreana sp. 5 TL-2023]
MLSKTHSDPDNQGTDSTFGVRSWPEATDEAKHEHDGSQGNSQVVEETENNGRRRSTLRAYAKPRDVSLEQSLHDNDDGAESPPFGCPRLSSALPSVSSLSQDSRGISHSLPSSPKSTSSRSGRPSDRDSVYDGGSQAVASSEDEAEIYQPSGVSDNAPQLIMPSIQMPSRRPFTERGRSMAKIKILLAGDSGLGKTSLIKSIVQVCEDIVHVDPVFMTASSVDQNWKSAEKDKPMRVSTLSTTHVNEVYASTKPYPGWWTELEENKSLRRRKSIDEPVLERNICFVDTPGYGRGLSITEGIQEVISYIDAQLARSLSVAVSNRGELVSLLCGDGGTQVDVVLYFIGRGIKPADLDFLHRLSQRTNVVPLIAESDTLEVEDIRRLKSLISDELAQLNVISHSLLADNSATPPFAVSSAPSNDQDNMDASLLMSSEYIQPLLPSELGTMIDQLFDNDNIAKLRYLSAKKLVQSTPALQLIRNAPSASGSFFGTANAASSFTPSQILTLDPRHRPFSQQSLAGSMKQEEEQAQVRLARWARNLRKTSRDGHAESKELEQSDLLSTSSDKSIILSELANTDTSPFGIPSANDPLGLLRSEEYLRRYGWRIFRVVGTFGVFGAVAVWVIRVLSTGNQWMPWSDHCSGWRGMWIECRPWTC